MSTEKVTLNIRAISGCVRREHNEKKLLSQIVYNVHQGLCF